MKPSEDFWSDEAVRCAIIHDLSNDLAVIVGACDLVGTEHLTQSAWERIRQIRATAMKMAKMIATRPCPIPETGVESISVSGEADQD